MPPFDIRLVRPDEDARWDAFVRRSPNGNAFLLSATLRALAAHETPVAQVRRIGAFAEGGTLEAGWAVLVRRRAGMRYCSSFPLFYAGPLLAPEWNEPDRATQRMDLLYGLAKEMQRGLDTMDTEAAPGLSDVRGLIYAGCVVEQIYSHIWPACVPEELHRLPNRSKRQEAAAAAKRHVFGWRQTDADLLETFDRLHNQTLRKFKWVASDTWRKSLLRNVATLEASGICRVFAAASVDEPERPCALVTVLFSREHRTAWLWRVAYQTDDSGLIPALYLHAAEAVKRENGFDWIINFGGSPNLSLARFKDYLGAVPTPHWRIRWQRYSLKAIHWNFLKVIKEAVRRRLTLWHILRSS
ncbi:MAG: hypothetical protein WCG03_01165 [Kiritimatiellales bacterium]